MRRPTLPAVWRNRDYMILWGGQFVSVTGTGTSEIAVPLLVLAITHSAADAGLVTALFGLPYPIFGLLAGGLVDRWDRKKVMIACNGISALVTATVPLAIVFGRISVAQLAIVAFVSGSVFVFFNVAEFAAIPSVVRPEDFPQATAQNQATMAVSGLLGPPLGGFIFQLSRALPFLADSISYTIAFLSLLFVRGKFRVERTAESRRLLVEIGEGMRWLWNNRVIRTLTLLTTGTNFLGGGLGILVIILARHQHAPPSVIGLIFAIGAIGGIVGAALGPTVQRTISLKATGLGFFWINAAAFPLYLIAPDAAVIGLISAVGFLTGPIYNVVFQTYRLSLIPPELLGRVNGSGRVIAWGAVPVGAATMGVLLQTAGISATILAMTAAYIVLAVAVSLTSAFDGVTRRPQPLTSEAQA